MLVSGSWDGTLKIWDLETYQEIRTLSCHEIGIYSVAVSADTKHIISGGFNKIVRLWCFPLENYFPVLKATAILSGELTNFSTFVTAVPFSQNGFLAYRTVTRRRRPKQNALNIIILRITCRVLSIG